jgi:hypothetical protein
MLVSCLSQNCTQNLSLARHRSTACCSPSTRESSCKRTAEAQEFQTSLDNTAIPCLKKKKKSKSYLPKVLPILLNILFGHPSPEVFFTPLITAPSTYPRYHLRALFLFLYSRNLSYRHDKKLSLQKNSNQILR